MVEPFMFKASHLEKAIIFRHLKMWKENFEKVNYCICYILIPETGKKTRKKLVEYLI